MRSLSTSNSPGDRGRRRSIGLAQRVLTEDFETLSSKQKKKALIVVCTYRSSDSSAKGDVTEELWGPGKDARKLKRLLMKHYGYRRKDIVILSDCEGSLHLPTQANILNEMRNLVTDIHAGDHLVFHYSGHGAQVDVKPKNANDSHSKHEAIVPCDAIDDPNNWILDDELRNELVKPLPIGCRLTAVFDCCHSGTALNLKHYRSNLVYVPWISERRQSSILTFRSLESEVPEDGVCIGRVEVCERTSSILITKCSMDFDVMKKTPDSPRRLSVMSRSSSLMIECDQIMSSPSISPIAGPSESRGRSEQQLLEATCSCTSQALGSEQRVLRGCSSQVLLSREAVTPTVESERSRYRPMSTLGSTTASAAARSISEPPTRKEADSKVEVPSLCAKCHQNQETLPAQPQQAILASERCRMSIHHTLSKSIPEESNFTPTSSPSPSPPLKPTRPLPLRSYAMMTATSRRSSRQRTSSLSTSGKENASPVGSCRSTSPESIQRCDSPLELPPSMTPKPEVYSISACANSQLTFESKNGFSMTATLVEILKKDRNPTWRAFMTDMSHELRNASLQRLNHYQRRQRKLLKLERKFGEHDSDDANVQGSSPVLSTASMNSLASTTSTSTSVMAGSNARALKEWQDEVMKEVLRHPDDIPLPLLGSEERIDLDTERFTF